MLWSRMNFCVLRYNDGSLDSMGLGESEEDVKLGSLEVYEKGVG